MINPSIKFPATEQMTPERQKEINDSTPEHPVVITHEDISMMSLNHVKLGLGSGRFQIPTDIPARRVPMDQKDKEEAKKLAARSGTQAKHAAQNSGRAAKVIAGEVVEDLEEGADTVVKTAKRVSPLALSRITGDTGMGFLALTVSIWAGTVAGVKFRQAYKGRHRVIS